MWDYPCCWPQPSLGLPDEYIVSANVVVNVSVTKSNMRICKNVWLIWYDAYGNGTYRPFVSFSATRSEARKRAKEWSKYINRNRKSLDIPFRKVKIVQYKLNEKSV